MATPGQVKVIIEREYSSLCIRARHGEINKSCIYGIIKARALNGARHNGCAGCWCEYMPKELMNNTEDQI